MFNIEFKDYTVNKYQYIGEFHEGLALVRNNKGLYGYINKRGKEVISCQFKNAKDFNEGLAPVQNKDGEWSYIDKKDNLVISCQNQSISYTDEYKTAYNFFDGIARVRRNYVDCFYINRQGKEITKKKLSRIKDFKNGFGVVTYCEERTEIYSYINQNGELFGEYRWCSSFDNNGFAVVCSRDDGNFYIINREFELIKRIKAFPKTCFWGSDTYSIHGFNEGMVLGLSSFSKKFFYDYINDRYLPCLFTDAREFKDGVAIGKMVIPEGFGVTCNCGFIRKDGFMKLFSENIYKEIRDFHEGLAAVQNVDRLWGFINKKGEEVIPCQFKQVADFSEGLSSVVDKNNNLYYIDKKGNKKLEMPVIYCSTLEMDGIELDGKKKDGVVVSIEAETEEELNNKKIQILDVVRKIIFENMTNKMQDIYRQIDEVGYSISTPHKKELKKQD